MRHSQSRLVPSHLPLRRLACTAVAMISCLGAEMAFSQGTGAQTQQRAQFVEGVLRTLVDSRLNLDDAVSLQSVPPASLSPEMRDARRVLEQFAGEAAKLIASLRRDERFSPGVRMLLGEALRIKANADVLVRRSQGMTKVAQLSKDFAELDSQWRLFAHQITQSPDLSQTSQQHAQRLNQFDEQLGNSLKLTPQLDNNALVHQLVAMDSDLSHLMDDIRIDLAQDSRQNEFTNAVYQLQLRLRHVDNAVYRNRPHNEIVAEYKRYRDAWLPVKTKLREIDNQYIQRNISRIADANDGIQELLWMPQVIDGNEILYLARVLKQDVDLFSDGVTLTQLLAIPDVGQIISSAQEFYGLVGEFQQSVTSKTQLEDLIWDFRGLEVAWKDVQQHVMALHNDELDQQLVGLENGIGRLRDAMGMRPVIDYEQTVEIASSLDYKSNELRYDMHRNVGQSRNYPAQFRRGAVKSTGEFHRTAHVLHDSLISQAGDEEIRQTCLKLTDQWQDLEGYISQVNVRDRADLIQTYQNIAPLVAKLQVLYTY
jgi:hypothetical protein